MHSTRTILLVAMATLALVLVPLPSTADAATTAAMPSDFDGDGYADLAIGAPGEDIGAKASAGAVNVIYGSSTGLRAAEDQSWSQDSVGIKGVGEGGGGCGENDCPGDGFGSAFASGDFDRDGYADLAVGAPYDRAGGVRFAGAVNVLYGSHDGLTASGDQLWSQDALPETPAAFDGFGMALAAGDFDGDGYWDLAIAARDDDPRGVADAGIVHAIYGGPDGLTANGTNVLTRSMTGTPDFPLQVFGAAVAAGDLDGDGRADLAVGAPDHSCMSSACVTTGGDVSVLYGTATGLSGDRAERLSQDTPGVEDAAETYDHFGSALAIGDFDADGFGDLAVGVPAEWIGACAFDDCAAPGQGAISVVYGSGVGLTADGDQFWNREVTGVPGAAKQLEYFGEVLASGDFDGDGADDLAIGVPLEDSGGLEDAGSVTILRGSVADGLTTTGAQYWTQASSGVPGSVERGDEFGFALASGNFGRTPHEDLAIGVPLENLGRIVDAGVVDVLYGGTTGLSGTNAQGWSQNTAGIRGTAERWDVFGEALGARSAGRR